jgi:hypothetical protein
MWLRRPLRQVTSTTSSCDVIGGWSGERAQRFIRGEVASAGDDFLGLNHGAAEQADSGSDAAGVGRKAAQAYGHAWCGGIVAKHEGGVVQPVHHDVEVAVVVEVAEGHALGDAGGAESPGGGDVGEREVTAIAEGNRRLAERRVVTECRCGPRVRGAIHGVLGVQIKHVMGVAGGKEDIFEAIEIDVQKGDIPGPIGCGDAGKLGDFSKGAVAAGQEQRVAGQLRLVEGIVEWQRLLGTEGVGALPVPGGVVQRQHLGDQQIIVSVPVDVRGIGRHGRQAHVAPGQGRCGAEASLMVLNPELIAGAEEIVADVKVR